MRVCAVLAACLLLGPSAEAAHLRAGEGVRLAFRAALKVQAVAARQGHRKVSKSDAYATQVFVFSHLTAANQLLQKCLQEVEHLAENATHALKALPQNVTNALKAEQSALETLFKHLKGNIMNSNRNEAQAKGNQSSRELAIKTRLAADEEKLNSSTISAFEHELLTNRTRVEKHELEYWSRDRELSHGMFHSNLKLTHGLMSRVQQVMEAYKEVLAKGKMDPKTAEAVHAASASIANTKGKV